MGYQAMRMRSGMPAFLLAFALAACGLFEYSPYEIPDEPDSGSLGPSSRTANNLGRLAAIPQAAGQPFSFVVMADCHTDLDELNRAVDHINRDTSIRFAVMAGDFTKLGLLREFEWFERAFSRLAIPRLTIIGNHDAIANGPDIYRAMYGPLDYAFTFQGVRFICVNNNIWDFSFDAPRWPWIESELAGAAGSLRLFVMSHIPPSGDQFDAKAESTWVSLMDRYDVEYSIHGHQHNYHHKEFYGDGVKYLIADNTGARNYMKLTVVDTGVITERVFF